MIQLKVCFIGIGSIGKRHIKNLASLCIKRDIQLQIDVLRATLREIPEDISLFISNEYQGLEQIDSFYDAVFITNPTFLHYKTIGLLKHHAKNFFVEKPVFSDTEHSIEELNLPQSNQYYVACPLRYSKVLQDAKEFVMEYRPISIRAICSSYLPDWRAGVDYRETYSAHKEQGGGCRIDLIHEWDYLVWMLGMPEEVYSFSGKYSDLEVDSEDLAVYIARYKSFLAELHLDYFGRLTERKVEVYTAEETRVFDIVNGKVFKNGKLVCAYEENANDKYIREMEYFLDIINGKNGSCNNLQGALDVLKLAGSNIT